MKKLFYSIIFVVLAACQSSTKEAAVESSETVTPKAQRPISVQNGKIFTVGDTKMMYGGEDSLSHFDISNSELNDEQFHYGIGREKFPALLAPAFSTVEMADTSWHDSTRFLVAYVGDEVKAYSVPDLTHHEVVNDMLGGRPIMAAYCILADLGAIYERTYGDKELTFALTGYTYYDDEVWDGLDGFVLWDRETESMWWPLIDRAVSGSLKGVSMLEMDKANWEDTDWKTVKEKYPNAMVLITGQDFERPTKWDKYDDVSDIVSNFSVADSN